MSAYIIPRPTAPHIEYALARLREGDAVRATMRDGSPFWIIYHPSDYGIHAYDVRHNGKVVHDKNGVMLDQWRLIDWLSVCLPDAP